MSEAIRRAGGPHRAVAWVSHSIAAWMRERIVAAESRVTFTGAIGALSGSVVHFIDLPPSSEKTVDSGI